MLQEGPLLESLLHRLSECPAEFLDTPYPGMGGINVLALVCDQLRAMVPGQQPDLDKDLKQLTSYSENHRSLLAVLSWLLHDEWFLNRAFLAPKMKALLLSAELASLATLVPARKMVEDPDRREELVRVSLRGLGLRPEGESEVQAADRLNTLDSAERVRVLQETAAAERRARQVREAMARQAAQDAASRYGE